MKKRDVLTVIAIVMIVAGLILGALALADIAAGNCVCLAPPCRLCGGGLP